MSIAVHIKASLDLPSMIVQGYLADLTDYQLFVRPQPQMNHIAWQLGHLIAGENFHINQVVPGSMPELPAGFAERHTIETAASDDQEAFYSKAEYVAEMQRQRTGTLTALAQLSDEQLLAPSPETINYFGPTVGSVFAGESTHWMMHAGQWAVIRRLLGKPPLY
ncbi:MAG: DinB family protein [Pirellulales bacterium]